MLDMKESRRGSVGKEGYYYYYCILLLLTGQQITVCA